MTGGIPSWSTPPLPGSLVTLDAPESGPRAWLAPERLNGRVEQLGWSFARGGASGLPPLVVVRDGLACAVVAVGPVPGDLPAGGLPVCCLPVYEKVDCLASDAALLRLCRHEAGQLGGQVGRGGVIRQPFLNPDPPARRDRSVGACRRGKRAPEGHRGRSRAPRIGKHPRPFRSAATAACAVGHPTGPHLSLRGSRGMPKHDANCRVTHVTRPCFIPVLFCACSCSVRFREADGPAPKRREN